MKLEKAIIWMNRSMEHPLMYELFVIVVLSSRVYGQSWNADKTLFTENRQEWAQKRMHISGILPVE